MTVQVGICVLIDSDVLPSLTFDMNVLPFDIRISPKQVHRFVVMAQDFRTEPDAVPTNDVPAATNEVVRHEPISPMTKDQAAVCWCYSVRMFLNAEVCSRFRYTRRRNEAMFLQWRT